ncbi:hypothetical protein ACFQQB_64555 [Nonomuraea rubra]|uniref:hypothetical protein n=1 Tax=Nonomuraea rubra TaxID=46180 RepID=UPI0036077524
MRAALTGGAVRLHSDQHAIEGYTAGPVPASPIPLWLGSQGPRMLAVTGRSSDGWISPLNIYVPRTRSPPNRRSSTTPLARPGATRRRSAGSTT